MSARFRSFKPWPSTQKAARRLTFVLCIGSMSGNLLIYLTSTTLPLSLLALNLAALSCAWLHYRYARKAINFQPQELAERLLEVQENERHRLSRELHDDIGQLLTAAKLQSQWLQRHAPESLHPQCATICATLDETLAKVRDVSAILNPRQLTSLGLEASLRAHMLRTLENTGVHWSLECQQRLTGIPEEMAVAAFRITQEAITNLLRHAQARNLVVGVQRLPEGLRLHVVDDGQGFVPAADPAREGQRGMAGMLERCEQLGGSLIVTSQPGQGTRIDALFPWAPRALERASTNKVL